MFEKKSGITTMRHIPKTGLAAALCLALGLALAPAAPALAQQAGHLRISQSQTGVAHKVQVGQDKSILVDLPVPAHEVIVSQPQVATAIMRNKRRAVVQGVNDGETNIFFLDASGNTIALLDIAVKSPPSRVANALEQAIKRVLPSSNINVESVVLENDDDEVNRVVLTGTAQSSGDAGKAVQIAAQFAGGEANVANVIEVNGSQQVKLKVTVAEVTRETVKQLGINLSGQLSTGVLTAGLNNNLGLGGASNVIGGNTATAGLLNGGLRIDATLKALERRGAVRTLAEPTLTAMSGKEASFLAGGQFPIPSGVEDGVITFDYRDFGVNLTFTPTVMSGGEIAMDVATKVSETTTEGGFSVQGITVPATREREANTSVKLLSGSTLAIAGLIEEDVRQQINELPGISRLPILGALFRSRDFVRSETELLILVTPYLAHAGGPVDLPTDDLVFAGDAEATFLGHMEKLYGVGEPVGGKGYKGSVGFVLD